MCYEEDLKVLRPTRLHYCQYLLSTHINYTLTHFAEHSESFSHDQINHYLSEDRLTPRLLGEHVKTERIRGVGVVNNSYL